MSRPLDTGDSQDAQFAVGSTTNMGVAYWDADSGPDGWEAPHHAQSSSQGWIEVTLSDTVVSESVSAAPGVRSLVAPVAGIVVDGDVGDWVGVTGLDMVLEAIDGESVAAQAATVKMAHDDANVYALVELDDDYDWVDGDLHKSASIALMFAIDSGAAVAMGAEEVDHELSFGVVDIWHWELECDSSVLAGGATSGPGDGKAPGNDAACNFDDEYATTPEDRHDDGSDTGENSLMGAWSHTSSSIGADGTYVFEMSRPLDTGDSQDAQFAVGSTTNMGVAYWDADSGPDDWEAPHHAQSSSQGWIEVTLS